MAFKVYQSLITDIEKIVSCFKSASNLYFELLPTLCKKLQVNISSIVWDRLNKFYMLVHLLKTGLFTKNRLL